MFVRQASFVVVLKRKSSFAGPEDIGWYISSWREYFWILRRMFFFGFWKYGDEEFFISFVLFVVNFSFSYICQIIFLGESIFVKLLLVSTLEQRYYGMCYFDLLQMAVGLIFKCSEGQQI